jgi:hypothetical protein
MRFLLLILSWWLSAGAEPVSNSDSGCHMDPLGGCSAETSPVSNADSGCGIDPLGGCHG